MAQGMHVRPSSRSFDAFAPSHADARVIAALGASGTLHRGRPCMMALLDVAERVSLSPKATQASLERLVGAGLAHSVEQHRGVGRSTVVLYGLMPTCRRSPAVLRV
jgi:hypothetical protein